MLICEPLAPANPLSLLVLSICLSSALRQHVGSLLAKLFLLNAILCLHLDGNCVSIDRVLYWILDIMSDRNLYLLSDRILDLLLNWISDLLSDRILNLLPYWFLDLLSVFFVPICCRNGSPICCQIKSQIFEKT